MICEMSCERIHAHKTKSMIPVITGCSPAIWFGGYLFHKWSTFLYKQTVDSSETYITILFFFFHLVMIQHELTRRHHSHRNVAPPTRTICSVFSTVCLHPQSNSVGSGWVSLCWCYDGALAARQLAGTPRARGSSGSQSANNDEQTRWATMQR